MVTMLLALVGVMMPAGVPYSASPLPQETLRGLESHAWGKRDGGFVFRMEGVGMGLTGLYLRFRGSSNVTWIRQRVYFTHHAGTIVMSYASGPSHGWDDVAPPGPDETCFTLRAIRWTARRLYWRELDATATQHANPWLDRKATGDGSCPIALGHLSPADQARLTLRWGREESYGWAPVPPPSMPAIGPPIYIPDVNDHSMTEPAAPHR